MTGTDITQHPIHLGLGALAESEPAFTGDMAWYAAYIERHAADGAEARLVSQHSFTQPWDKWEAHPEGAEVVLCIAGAMTLHLEHADGSVDSVALTPGQYAIVPRGTWHTADVETEATALFITPGIGTQHRPR